MKRLTLKKRKKAIDDSNITNKQKKSGTKKGESSPIKDEKKKKKKNYYFTMDVQNKIVEYQNTNCQKEKSKLYEFHIYPAFRSLVHSLVSVYGFKSSNEDIAHLKSDCVTFLFETIHKWSPDKKSKAFSYFNVVAKNWLTIQSRRLLKNQRRSAYIDDPYGLTFVEKSELFDREYVDPHFLMKEKNEKFKNLLKMIDYIEEHLKDEKDIKCCFAIKKVFNSIDDLEFFNKRAVFVYLREISGLNSTELSSSLSSIRKIYRKVAGPDKMFDIF
jgi:hypothetical protein